MYVKKEMFGKGSAIGALTGQDSHLVAQIAKKIHTKAILKQQNLIDIIENDLGYPSQHREVCWRYILQLPMNEDQYQMLAEQSLHPKIRTLPNRLPIKFSAISNRLVRIVSALTYWHPPLAECDWLPSLVFPFLQTMGRDSLILFEIIVTVINNWCQEWLHFVPNPPITILSRIEHIAKSYGGSAPMSDAWPALRSFFSEVATTDACLALIDNILSSKPVFLEYLVAAYCLRKNKRIDNLNVKAMIAKAKKMYEQDSPKNPNKAEFTPLVKGYYPVMPIITKTTDWKEKELERIRAEAEVARVHMSLEDNIDKEEERLKRKRRNWMATRTVLKQIEDEQMLEFRRREKENLVRDCRKEDLALRRRQEQQQNRRMEEENAIMEWRDDCRTLQEEMKSAAETRQKTWELWLKTREDVARQARAEADTELELLKRREAIQTEEFDRHMEITREAEDEEQAMLRRAIARSQEIEDEKYSLREQLETKRRQQSEDFLRRQMKLQY